VTFLNGTATLATTNVNATGIATATSSTLAVGTLQRDGGLFRRWHQSVQHLGGSTLTVIAMVPAPVVTLSASPASVTVGSRVH